ncbi:hypothetical protein KCP73_00235 [Salmonella enterica subsp. enterica]|nr:hypothetical protein KCP73_00235 [Salmonella enterica subsp. enterica]
MQSEYRASFPRSRVTHNDLPAGGTSTTRKRLMPLGERGAKARKKCVMNNERRPLSPRVVRE